MASVRTKAVKSTEKSSETRRRILDMSRQMFNRQGLKATAVLKIAYELGMSPGNLTYHFKNKSDIVLELASALSTEIENAIYQMKSPLKAEQVIQHLEMVLKAFWSYRFLFNSALYLSQMDEASSSRVSDVKQAVVEMLSRYFESTVERGEMRAPRQPDGILLLAENVTSIWLQWLLDESIAHPQADAPSRAGLYSGMRHHFGLIDAYVGRRFATVARDEIARLYG